jgi:tRNA pseudouridine38-40 synthase
MEGTATSSRHEGSPDMRNIRLILAYEGTHFSGWQYQPNDRTVQGTLEESLSVITARPTRVTGSGRTDAGVHALGQAVNFRTESCIECRALAKGLNSLLPADVRVLDADEVADSFDARRSAILRVYRYLIYTGPVVSPFLCRYAWHVPGSLDAPAMQRAGAHLVGTHDFASFASSGETGGTTREVFSFRVEETDGGMIIVEVAANAFLRHMVRAVVGTIVDVGKGKISRDEFREVLAAKDRARAGVTAPPEGLFLVEVRYP